MKLVSSVHLFEISNAQIENICRLDKCFNILHKTHEIHSFNLWIGLFENMNLIKYTHTHIDTHIITDFL